MRKITLFLFSLFALLASVTIANAQETKSPYKVDFNSAIATDDHAFLVDVGWDHTVSSVDKDYYGGQRYVEYTYSATDGREGTGSLQVGTQKLRDVYGEYSYVKDYLITPIVTGSSSIWVKKAAKYTSSKEGFLIVYKMKKSNGNWVVDGSPIYSSNNDQIEGDDWTEIDLPEVNGVRLGIYASYVSLDDFEAENAKIELKKEMSITSSSSIGTYTDADADGNYTFNFNVTVKNTGGTTLNPGDAGYQVDIKNAAGKIVKTIAIDKALEAGDSYTIPVSVTLNIADYPDASYYYAYEGISETKTTIAKVIPVAYAPVLKLTNGSKEVGDDYVLNFGSTKTAKSSAFTIANDGGKDLIVSNLAVSGDFTLDAEAPLTVKPHEKVTFNVSMPINSVGEKSGSLSLKSDAGNKTITLKGTVVDPNKWYADFEDGKIPAGMIADKDGIWSAGMKGYALRTDDNMYVLKAYDYSNSATIATPLFNIKKGDALAFEVSKSSSSSSLVVKYSKDRVNWIVAKEFKPSDLSSEQENGYYVFTPVTVEIPEGKYYVGFESKSIYIDNITGLDLADVEHDWFLKSVTIGAKGQVNSKLSASATLFNVGVKSEEADSYKATLYVDGQAVATATPEAITGGETKSFAFTYTPHTAGTFKAYVEFAAGEYKVASAEQNVVISDEEAVSDVQIGEPKERSNKTAPLNIYVTDSQSAILYPASKLTSLSKGDKITKIAFRGYISSASHLNSVTNISVWMSNTASETLEAPTALPATENMTKVFDGAYDFKDIGSSSDAFDKDAEIFIIDLAEPFVYDGNGISLVCTSKVNGWASVYFQQVEKDENLSYMRSIDNDGDVTKATFSSKPLPVVHFVVTNEPMLVTGTITDSETNKVVANANVKFVSGDIEYSGTTDENGQYSIEVIKTGLTYKAKVTAEGYKALDDATVELITANNFKLESATPTGISEISESESVNSAIVYNAQGILVSKNGLVGLKPGLYIVNGKKIIKK